MDLLDRHDKAGQRLNWDYVLAIKDILTRGWSLKLQISFALFSWGSTSVHQCQHISWKRVSEVSKNYFCLIYLEIHDKYSSKNLKHRVMFLISSPEPSINSYHEW